MTRTRQVHQLEVSLAKLSEAWDALIALGGIMTSHPMAFSIMEVGTLSCRICAEHAADRMLTISQNVVKLLRENNKQMPDNVGEGKGGEKEVSHQN